MFPARQGIAFTPSVSLQRLYGLLSRRIIIEPMPLPPLPPAPPAPDIAISAMGFICPLTSVKKKDSRLQLRKKTPHSDSLQSKIAISFHENQNYIFYDRSAFMYFFLLTKTKEKNIN